MNFALEVESGGKKPEDVTNYEFPEPRDDEFDEVSILIDMVNLN